MAAQTTDIHKNIEFHHGLGKQTLDTTMASRGSTDHRRLSRMSSPENDLLFISDIRHRSELMCVFGQTPTKHFPRRGFEQEPLWWHSQLSVSPFKSICICTIWSLPRRDFVPLLLSQGRTQMPSLGCTHPLPSQLLSPLFCAVLELFTHFSSFLLLSLLFLSADPNRSNEQ